MFRSDRLIELRNRSRLTQEKLAEKLNLTKSAVSNYENGHSGPNHETLTTMADVLNTTTDYLLGRIDVSYSMHDIQVMLNAVPAVTEANVIIKLLEEEAYKIGLSPSDPQFLKMIKDFFQLIGSARNQD